jgi:hypothetical protein
METQIRQNWTSKPAFRLALVFVAGYILGMLVFYLIGGSFKKEATNTSEVKGTLYSGESYDQMKVADNLVYDNPAARATIDVRYSTKLVELHLTLSSPSPVKVIIDFNYSDFSVLNVQNISVNPQTAITCGGNFIQIDNTGDNQYICQLYNKNSLPNNINFRIFQNDMVIYQNSVQVNRE